MVDRRPIRAEKRGRSELVSNAARRERLRPWLALAEVVRKIHQSGIIGPLLQPELRDLFLKEVGLVIDQFPEPLRGRLRVLQKAKNAGLLYGEAFNAFAVLSRISQWKPDLGDMPLASVPLAPERLGVAVRKGRIQFAAGVVNDALLPLLQGIEAQRVRTCPVCGNFFYALRIGDDGLHGSKACSKRCNNTLRQRRNRHRRSEYEYRRKLRSAGLKERR